MSTVAILLAAVALLVLVIYWSGRYGGRARGGTSLRRRPHAHTNANGTPKTAFATRDDAEERARTIAKRVGAPMSAYQCETCAKWHVGHSR